jgi:hypothetical protein
LHPELFHRLQNSPHLIEAGKDGIGEGVTIL